MRQELVNGDTALDFRGKCNENFEELYTELTESLQYLMVLTEAYSDSGAGTFPSARPDGTSYQDGDWYYIADGGDYDVTQDTGAGNGSALTCYEGDMLIRNQNSTWERFEGSNKGPKETIQYSSGTVDPPGETDPLSINTITHSFTKTYSTAPEVVIDCVGAFWGLFISSVSTTEVEVGCSGTGDATAANFDYKVQVF